MVSLKDHTRIITGLKFNYISILKGSHQDLDIVIVGLSVKDYSPEKYNHKQPPEQF